MLPFSLQTARTFWLRIAESVAAGERLVLVAEHAGQIVGTVQLVIDQPENQPHRADVAKLLVHQNARRQGLANAMMNYLEQLAREQGKSVLALIRPPAAAQNAFMSSVAGKKPGKFRVMP